MGDFLACPGRDAMFGAELDAQSRQREQWPDASPKGCFVSQWKRTLHGRDSRTHEEVRWGPTDVMPKFGEGLTGPETSGDSLYPCLQEPKDSESRKAAELNRPAITAVSY